MYFYFSLELSISINLRQGHKQLYYIIFTFQILVTFFFFLKKLFYILFDFTFDSPLILYTDSSDNDKQTFIIILLLISKLGYPLHIKKLQI